MIWKVDESYLYLMFYEYYYLFLLYRECAVCAARKTWDFRSRLCVCVCATRPLVLVIIVKSVFVWYLFSSFGTNHHNLCLFEDLVYTCWMSLCLGVLILLVSDFNDCCVNTCCWFLRCNIIYNIDIYIWTFMRNTNICTWHHHNSLLVARFLLRAVFMHILCAIAVSDIRLHKVGWGRLFVTNVLGQMRTLTMSCLCVDTRKK